MVWSTDLEIMGRKGVDIFGALVCKAQNPMCGECPMKEECNYNTDK